MNKKKRIDLYISAELQRKVKHLAVDIETSISGLYQSAMEAEFLNRKAAECGPTASAQEIVRSFENDQEAMSWAINNLNFVLREAYTPEELKQLSEDNENLYDWQNDATQAVAFWRK